MNFKQLEKIVERANKTLYREVGVTFWGEDYKYKIAQNCEQYTGGDNTPIYFSTLSEIKEYFELNHY